MKTNYCIGKLPNKKMNNIIIGPNAGCKITSGDNNLIIGRDVNLPEDNMNNQIIFGNTENNIRIDENGIIYLNNKKIDKISGKLWAETLQSMHKAVIDMVTPLHILKT